MVIGSRRRQKIEHIHLHINNLIPFPQTYYLKKKIYAPIWVEYKKKTTTATNFWKREELKNTQYQTY